MTNFAVEYGKRVMKLNKTLKPDLVALVMKHETYIRRLESTLDEVQDELRNARVSERAAQSVADLRDIEVHENAVKYHKMARNYHGLALDKERKLTEEACFHSRGLEADVDDMISRVLDPIGVKYVDLGRAKQKKLVNVLRGICERIKVPF